MYHLQATEELSYYKAAGNETATISETVNKFKKNRIVRHGLTPPMDRSL